MNSHFFAIFKRFRPNALNFATGWRTPRASRREHPQQGHNTYKHQPDFHRKIARSPRFLLTSRPISYIMSTKKSAWVYTTSGPVPPHLPGSSPSSLLLVGRFRGFLLREFVVDVLLEQMRIGSHHAPPVHEDRRCAGNFELLAVRAAGIHGLAGLRAGHAALECIGVQPGLSGVVHHFCPGVRRRNDVL